jgi:aerotaxis receptor
MRLNMPITTTCYNISDKETIVSTTDLQGNITYANPYFVEVSGFTLDELIGSPQNIVRHPDMPVEAFADLWHTIGQGLPWSGMVKNRCKNGDYYWVVANVTPIVEDGKAVGFMSVRTKPSQVQVDAAARLYASFKAGNPQRLALLHGAPTRTDLWTRLRRRARVSIGTRIAASVTLMVGTLAALGLTLTFPLADAGVRQALQCLTLLAVLVGVHFWYMLAASVLAPLRAALAASRIMAGGDLTGTIPSTRDDEVGQLLRVLSQLRVNLRSIVGDVRSNSHQIGISTREIATGNMDLSGRTESQASALEETASSMEELASTVLQNAGNAEQARRMADDAAQVAGVGDHVVTEVIDTMAAISAASKKIIDIIGIIEGIAFQTNILALNAAVEAARAGEQGRGFAVVAAEVRNLAQRSATAAKEIKQLIDVSIEKVDAGSVLAARAGTTMQEIIVSVGKVNQVMGEISEASREQSAGIAQVNDAVTQMDEVTQQNAALVEQAAAAAASLNEQADNLNAALRVFKLDSRARQAPAGTRTSHAQSAPQLALGRT